MYKAGADEEKAENARLASISQNELKTPKSS
jgi:hypothetical protein